VESAVRTLVRSAQILKRTHAQPVHVCLPLWAANMYVLPCVFYSACRLISCVVLCIFFLWECLQNDEDVTQPDVTVEEPGKHCSILYCMKAVAVMT